MYSRLVVILTLLSLISGYLQSESRADIPAACPQYECKTVHAYWGGSANSVSAFHVKNSDATTGSGIEDIFTTSSVEKKKLQDTTGDIDKWSYPSCTPSCGKDLLGTWQATQEVTKAGAKIKDSKVTLPRRPCSPTEKGVEGPTNPNPTNANINKNTPPGVPVNPPGGD